MTAVVTDYTDVKKFGHFNQHGFGIDARDVDTPDKWVPRHPSMIRLTGRHPYNVEAPLPKLIDQGMITPPALHFVRDHGAVPQLDWDTHSIEISGLVEKPLTITMQDIVDMPNKKTFPVTVTCAGNRRKEQNMTKQTVGFNWGPAGTSCSNWTGVPLRDFLIKAGVKTRAEGANFVCFEGADKLPNGFYGTSLPYDHAMDPLRDVIIAYEQNGERLMPDHGYPVRMIIPGWIGGRMVKWLTKIMVTEKESDNYYHFFDNRILPPQVIQLATAASKYTMRGYAYTGGGRRVGRVEISFDSGDTWDLSVMKHLPDSPGGYNWCWCFWTYEADVSQLLAAANGELRVRAWDGGSNTQPDRLTWNVMGMGNNPHFKVKVHAFNTDKGLALWFEHPTIPGPGAGGWMVKPADEFPLGTKKLTLKAPPAGNDKWIEELTSNAAYSPLAMIKGAVAAGGVEVPAAPKVNKDGARMISMKEVEQHQAEDDAWIVVRGKVYDATPYLEKHPGGSASITMNSGADATEDFEAVHSTKAWKLLEDFYIGELGEESSRAVAGGANAESAGPLVTLDPKKKVSCKLIQKDELSHDVRRFRFALPSEEHILGLPVGNHFFVNAKINGTEPCMRAYTPTSSDADKGYFDLVIKVYFKNVHPRFPDGGKMSQHLESLALGDSIEIKGPIGHFTYLGRGAFKVKSDLRSCKEMGFICGGTGITPAYQVMKEALKDKEDTTKFYLLYANQTPADILLREELDAWAVEFPDRVSIWYTVDRLSDEEVGTWKFSKGFIDEAMLKKSLPACSAHSFIGMCGPPPMINFACIPNLNALGFTAMDYVSF
ncbi:NAD(P)H-nitrate reductase [Baffinella frigidus]|nr:NAD(P)H-nitrate reductase [Cryptophyta sp. CCMP2293]